MPLLQFTPSNHTLLIVGSGVQSEAIALINKLNMLLYIYATKRLLYIYILQKGNTPTQKFQETLQSHSERSIVAVIF
jgi:hypothetical protein